MWKGRCQTGYFCDWDGHREDPYVYVWCHTGLFGVGLVIYTYVYVFMFLEMDVSMFVVRCDLINI